MLQAHSCFTKAAMVAGIQHVRLLPASRATDFAVQPQQLEQAVGEDLAKGLIPFYFMATIGKSIESRALPPLTPQHCRFLMWARQLHDLSEVGDNGSEHTAPSWTKHTLLDSSPRFECRATALMCCLMVCMQALPAAVL